MSKLLEQIKKDSIIARKTKSVDRDLLITLYSDCAMVGKSNGNRLSTDVEVIGVLKKFKAGLDIMIKALNRDKEKNELEVINKYLPKQLTFAELYISIGNIIKNHNYKTPAMMGSIMAELKSIHGGNYDGKAAAEIVKSLLK